MDQDNSKGQDKRNWRERLGIGAQGGKELPKISDDFRKEAPPAAARPVASAARPVASVARPAIAGVKPAPMAPRAPAPMVSRANPKAISPVAPVSPEKLAERLRSQREASTKLAEQRVQVAKQRAEAQQAPVAIAPVPQAAAPVSGAKPKFTFAEEAPSAKPAAPVQARPVAPVPPPVAQQLAPPRPPLGAQQVPNGFTQRPPPPAYQPPPPPPNYQPSGFGNQPFQPNYSQQPVPPYRPIDPNTGYAPQPGYAPLPQQRGFGVPPQQGGFAPPAGGPRLNVPQRTGTGLNPNFAPPQAGFNAGPRLSPPPQRAPLPPVGQENEYEEEYYDDAPAPRGVRPTSNDYQQAYREAEYGYEEEAPRSKAPWILAGLVLLTMLMAGLGVWLYQSSIKPLMTGQTGTQEVPAVAAPENPAKVQAEQPEAAQQPAVATPTKKQIYDRIVGDQEILGGDVAPPAEAPAAIPEPTPNDVIAPQPSGGAGEDAAPLPIPPPPGGAGDQQGSLVPATEKQSAENITPAAGESQAAVAAPSDAESDPVATASAAAPPAPGEIAPPAASAVAEEITDTAPVIAEKKKPAVVAKKKIEAAKPKQVAEKSLGSKPVVLVAPSKKAKAAASKPIANNDDAIGSEVAANDGGIYGGEGIATPEQTSPVVAAQPKKKKTLADLFRGEDATPSDEQIAEAAPTVAAKPAIAPKPKVVEAPVQVASGAGGFMVQLASFRSKAEATTEFTRLKAKHSGTLGRFSPIISEATVGGATRYRLSVGSMESQAQANAVCSSLFAGGERDCLVKRR